MGSKLSSLLVQGGLLPVKTLQDVLALQVIRGGQLDTILLEKQLVSETALQMLASKATGWTVAEPELFDEITPDAAETIDLEQARKLMVCPVKADEDSVTLLVTESTDSFALENLAYEIDRSIYPYVTTEIRLLQAQEVVYRTPLERRYIALLDLVGPVPPPPEERVDPQAPQLIIEPTRPQLRSDPTPKDTHPPGYAEHGRDAAGVTVLTPLQRQAEPEPEIEPESLPLFEPESPPVFEPESPPVFEPESPPVFEPESPLGAAEPEPEGQEAEPEPIEVTVEAELPGEEERALSAARSRASRELPAVEPTADVLAEMPPIPEDADDDADTDDGGVLDRVEELPERELVPEADELAEMPSAPDADAQGEEQEPTDPGRPRIPGFEPLEQEEQALLAEPPEAYGDEPTDPGVRPHAEEPTDPGIHPPHGVATEEEEPISLPRVDRDQATAQPREVWDAPTLDVPPDRWEAAGEITTDAMAAEPRPPVQPDHWEEGTAEDHTEEEPTLELPAGHWSQWDQPTDRWPIPPDEEEQREQEQRFEQEVTDRVPIPPTAEEPELGAEPEPELGAEPELEAKPEPELEAKPEPELEAEPEPELGAEPEPARPLADVVPLHRTAPVAAKPELGAEPELEAKPEPAPEAPVPAAASEALPLEHAVEALKAAATRDELLLALARGVRNHVDSVQIYVVKGSTLQGQMELSVGPPDRITIRNRSLSLEIPSVISRAVDSGTVYLGPTPNTDASASVLAVGGILRPASLVLVPVVLKEKTICLAVGYTYDQPVASGERAPLSMLAQEAALALAQLIVRLKRTKPKPAEVDDIPSVTSSRTVISDIRAPAGSGEEPPDLIMLLHALEEGGAAAQQAEESLRGLGKEAIQALISWFPGRVRHTRFATELPPVSECSPVLQALVAIGRPVLSSIAPLLLHPDAEIRFYATYLISELIYPEAVALLARQLRDLDPEVRRVAAKVLSRFRKMDQFPFVLDELRNDLANPDPRPRRGAAEALGALGDEGAVEDLLGLLGDHQKGVADAARRALVNLTKQDLGSDSQGWRQWWEQNRSRVRIEWLFDGLVHEDPDIRASSAAELESATGKTFGYSFDMPEAEREAVRRRFLEWWSLQGR